MTHATHRTRRARKLLRQFEAPWYRRLKRRATLKVEASDLIKEVMRVYPWFEIPRSLYRAIQELDSKMGLGFGLLKPDDISND